MLNIAIIALILVGITVHNYLSSYWEQGLLPYSIGFLFFANSFALVYLVSFIWMFGIVAGIIIALLCFLQLVYSAGLWIFIIPWLININRNFAIPRVNPLIYGGFSFLVEIVAILTVVNFFVSPYKSMWELMGENVWTPILIFFGVLVVGNVARITLRITLMSKFVKE